MDEFLETGKSGQIQMDKIKGSQESPLGDSNPNHPPGRARAASNCPGLFGQSKATQSQVLSWGQLAAPSGIRAPSPNTLNGLGSSNATLNQICWVLQQICYQTDLLQNSTSISENFQIPAAASAAPYTVVPPTPNQSNCTDVLVSHLAATEDAVDATNKLVDNSTSVKLQDSEILEVNNQVKSQAEDANQLSTSHQQSSPAQTKSPKNQSKLPKPLSTTSQKPVPKS
ncbi:hypothetical protein DSO57_1000398 [Entomophthora muscae]|uniref:Uncharacterized protein n=1 Tax=Entomophthora muscae TaxID=34485 RepID=A0ACC2UJ31_9FUNG|nr:hypothetical protein DSO57_1000398 [Entomophthora muscae]